MKMQSKLLIAGTFIILFTVLIGCQNLPGKNAFLTVDESSCMGCGECVKVCEADAIILIGGKAVIDPSKCKQCGKCVKVCPNDAIH
ncbi:MAG: 4Fe-4S binding protein [Chitinispirillaceae bacterium]|nr:4Fe-4S binding protein [Chitinispirillaceae bacterium]